MEFSHRSVLLWECIEALNIQPDGVYLDGTLGGAGHSLEICRNLTTGRLIGVDRDETALAAVAAGADGLLIEVHDRPAAALSDPAQSMSCTAFAQLAEKLQKVRQAIEA